MLSQLLKHTQLLDPFPEYQPLCNLNTNLTWKNPLSYLEWLGINDQTIQQTIGEKMTIIF